MYSDSYSVFEEKLGKIPERLGKRAYISEYIVPLMELNPKVHPQTDRFLNAFITKEYIKNYLLEYENATALKDTSIEIELYYESPKQVNTYTKTIHADYHALVIAHSESSRREAAKIAVRQERLKMSAGLRYQVLQRDQFRCQICGATKEDGVKLHVDHILPVSKGGKTELSNLRTLCDRCNLGKSDSYNPYDVN